jgi:hypothetical protein
VYSPRGPSQVSTLTTPGCSLESRQAAAGSGEVPR